MFALHPMIYIQILMLKNASIIALLGAIKIL